MPNYIFITNHAVESNLVKPILLNYIKSLADINKDCQYYLFSLSSKTNKSAENKRASHSNIKIIEYNPRFRSKYVLYLFFLFFIVREIRKHNLKSKNSLSIGYLSYGGTFTYILKFLFGFDYSILCYEPHSMYMLEQDIWGRCSPSFHISRYFEKCQLKYAKKIIVPTTHTYAKIVGKYDKMKIEIAPISIQLEDIVINYEQSNEIILSNDLLNSITIGYVGQFGGIYSSVSEYFNFLYNLSKYNNTKNICAYIITDDIGYSIVQSHLNSKEYSFKIILLQNINVHELPTHINCFDYGVVLIPPTPSQCFRSPVKTIYYIASGVPVIIPNNISDDSAFVDKTGFGIVIESFNSKIQPYTLISRGAKLASNCSHYRIKLSEYRNYDKMIFALNSFK